MWVKSETRFYFLRFCWHINAIMPWWLTILLCFLGFSVNQQRWSQQLCAAQEHVPKVLVRICAHHAQTSDPHKLITGMSTRVNTVCLNHSLADTRAKCRPVCHCRCSLHLKSCLSPRRAAGWPDPVFWKLHLKLKLTNCVAVNQPGN